MLSLQEILKLIRNLGFYYIISKKQKFRLCIISKKEDSLNSDDLYLETITIIGIIQAETAFM